MRENTLCERVKFASVLCHPNGPHGARPAASAPNADGAKPRPEPQLDPVGLVTAPNRIYEPHRATTMTGMKRSLPAASEQLIAALMPQPLPRVPVPELFAQGVSRRL
ncbi:hypothetical protein GCM10027610_056660 [Dactylosporangium cerinum]